MIEFLQNLFKPDFAPRYSGGCSGWNSTLSAISSIQNFLIFVAYLAIPSAIIKARVYNLNLVTKSLSIWFSAFILSCGIGHLIAAITNYYPFYRFMILWNGVTALVSMATVMMLFKILPTFTIVSRTEYKESVEKLKEANALIAKLSVRDGT